jgi:hypothetical protein
MLRAISPRASDSKSRHGLASLMPSGFAGDAHLVRADFSGGAIASNEK